MNESEFLNLIKKYEAAIYKVCWMFAPRDTELVKDLYQDIVIHLWNGYKSTKTKDVHFNWVYRIALNTAITFSRKKKTKPILEFSDKFYEIEDCADDPLIPELYLLIEKLNSIEKSIIYLYLEKKSHQEISEILGISVSNVGTKIQRIKLKMKNMMNNNK